jgi:hypothetical protein
MPHAVIVGTAIRRSLPTRRLLSDLVRTGTLTIQTLNPDGQRSSWGRLTPRHLTGVSSLRPRALSSGTSSGPSRGQALAFLCKSAKRAAIRLHPSRYVLEDLACSAPRLARSHLRRFQQTC